MRNMEYDRLMCTYMFLCDTGLDTGSVICKLYLAQRLGFNLGFHFKASQGNILCNKADTYLDTLTYNGVLNFETKEGTYNYKRQGLKDAVPMDYSEQLVLEDLLEITDDLSSVELAFVCTLDMLQVELNNQKKRLSIEEQKQFITNSLSRWYSFYSEDVFLEASKRVLLLDALRGKIEC